MTSSAHMYVSFGSVEDPHEVESCVASVLEQTSVDEPMCMASRTMEEQNVESGVDNSTERERDRVSSVW
jgi:hypothetical protein